MSQQNPQNQQDASATDHGQGTTTLRLDIDAIDEEDYAEGQDGTRFPEFHDDERGAHYRSEGPHEVSYDAARDYLDNHSDLWSETDAQASAEDVDESPADTTGRAAVDNEDVAGQQVAGTGSASQTASGSAATTANDLEVDVDVDADATGHQVGPQSDARNTNTAADTSGQEFDAAGFLDFEGSTVSGLQESLKSGEHDSIERLQTIANAEAEGENRSTAYEALESRARHIGAIDQFSRPDTSDSGSDSDS